ncbi:hypothetical protein [uncultured Streptococcus sp.]|uniref:hypothetical protein n=1 Tax=uncultured Streptococcus sp. TaxID=83427 RepID=UPI0027DC0546|nr:hypothetical protein [uncultured Streptococcus sp.]
MAKLKTFISVFLVTGQALCIWRWMTTGSPLHEWELSLFIALLVGCFSIISSTLTKWY